MPVVPIIYSWFYYICDNPILRFFPIGLFIFVIILVYKIGNIIFLDNKYISYLSVISFISMISFILLILLVFSYIRKPVPGLNMYLIIAIVLYFILAVVYVIRSKIIN